MKAIFSALFVSSLLVGSAVAAPKGALPLPSGKPAGVKEAALLGPNVFLVFLSAGIIIGGISLAVSNPGNNGVTSPTTSSTSP